MKTEFTLVEHNHFRQGVSIYKSNREIKWVAKPAPFGFMKNELVPLLPQVNEGIKRLKEEYQDQKPTAIYHIAISSATTHAETLVFPAFPITRSDGSVVYAFDSLPIAGEYTMLIYGGDHTTQHEDEYYLDVVAKNNDQGYELEDNK